MLDPNVKLTSSVNSSLASSLPEPPALGGRRLLSRCPWVPGAVGAHSRMFSQQKASPGHLL